MLDSRACLLFAGLCLAAFGAALAGDDERPRGKRDHEAARRALQQGAVRALSEILAELRTEIGGHVIEVELERTGKTFVYEFKVLTSSGRLRELKVDATTGKVIKQGDAE